MLVTSRRSYDRDVAIRPVQQWQMGIARYTLVGLSGRYTQRRVASGTFPDRLRLSCITYLFLHRHFWFITFFCELLFDFNLRQI
jgi:hypothetical protein